MSAVPLSGLVVSLPDASVDHLVGVVEVLVQEGIGTFAVPVHAEALEVLPPIFGARARIGAASVRSADDARRAIELGAGFILADLVDDGVITTANDAAIAHYAPAMTPTEVRAVLARPITGVALTPADVVGHAMAAHLRDLGIVDRVVPIGGIGAYAAGEWMKAGAPAAAVGSTLLGDSPTGGDLAKLRDRCGSFRNAVPKEQREPE
ncbi:bifunctional 4-hydroxy-2-oxoglutarate aldolase/2-dehydro-3-deoxy-phosphogluconate aldolase [Tessaracoccus caeni]|uniref:bifunctional 4-hydroxy-2-oxoglutarate aldolase/2-dehydro-3-deoxy-phosphogluconate aldolase n=1 Tax=Tessaracoccus caeni TaxID=3031239 RepID=UPI0023DB305C|nr:bifunctional 4-hydroxy-2-oxoglutarate aldolase/2-dehydro-3-deoxy-phosphogluconate aldolase [Tessaracoccus caeni]MDF1487273.1 bifunctional 4-hydroxy-2-oxoglutarate aldolase/2-dehydro-3-deoxy-phosphogluconate aldolase [Tessaracoccus caeni]